MDLIELKWTKVDRIGPKLTEVDWSRLNQTKLMKWTKIEWIECHFVISLAMIVYFSVGQVLLCMQFLQQVFGIDTMKQWVGV